MNLLKIIGRTKSGVWFFITPSKYEKGEMGTKLQKQDEESRQAPLFHKKPPTLEEIRVRFMLLCITKSCHHWIAIESCYYTQGIHPNIFSYWLADLCISFKKALQWKAYSLLISCLSSCLLFPIFGLGLINQLKTVKPDEDLCNRGSQFWNGWYTVLVSRFCMAT